MHSTLKNTKKLLFASKELDNGVGADLAEALKLEDLLLQFVDLGPHALELERGPDGLGVQIVEVLADLVHVTLHVRNPLLHVKDSPH